MTEEQIVQELSNNFDVLYNNITSNQAPGLNEYEKSLFLTKAQKELIKGYFSPKGNPKQEGYDDSPKRQSDFLHLVETIDLARASQYADAFDSRSIPFYYSHPTGGVTDDDKIEQDRSEKLLILNEHITYTNQSTTPYKRKIWTIVPISYDEYDRLMQKPYKYPPKNQVWRLFSGKTSTHTGRVVVEIIGRFTAEEEANLVYKVRYLKNPDPIILEELPDGLTIDGKNEVSIGSVPEYMYDEVLQRAVELAKIAWTSTGQDNTQLEIQAGQRSE